MVSFKIPTHLFSQTGGKGEAPGTDRQEASPFFPEGIHLQVRVQPKVNPESQINVLLKKKVGLLHIL